MTPQTATVPNGQDAPTSLSPRPRSSNTIGLSSSRRTRITLNLPADLVEQMRDAVYWTPGVTLAWLVASAMKSALSDLQVKNQGPFPRRTKPLRAGRPRMTGQAMTVHALSSTKSPVRTVDPHPRPVVGPQPHME